MGFAGFILSYIPVFFGSGSGALGASGGALTPQPHNKTNNDRVKTLQSKIRFDIR